MRRAAAAALAAALAGLCSCRGSVHSPSGLDVCASAPPLLLVAPLSTVRVGTSFDLSAAGGTGPDHWQFGVDGAGSVLGARYT
ncbi:MAG TPA: hypothetical protein VND93_22405, partial [Myxococcales bacterium]|nr:hypothetical protein [Myxococcales bacterium]